MSDADLSKAIEVARDRLYYCAVRIVPYDRPDVHFFTVDDSLHYWPFFLDFGPLSLGNLYRFCQLLNSKLNDRALTSKRLVLYSGPQSNKRANAVFLLAAYMHLYHGRSAEEAWRPFAAISPALPPWHDASPGLDGFNLTVLDTLRGIAKAREARFFSFDSFDIEEFEHYERVENGDMNWIAQGRFLAFAGPHDARASTMEGYHTTAVDDVVPYFKAKGVTAVVRLNKKYYNERRFTAAGIDHHDMYYLDGSNPPEPILQRFLDTAEATPGAIAVHCKAGLGRTGTCIGAYMMKHYRFSAREAIGWMRICRPGSVIGPQQFYMEEIQQRMWDEGEAFRRTRRLPMPVPSSPLGQAHAAAAAATSAAAREAGAGIAAGSGFAAPTAAGPRVRAGSSAAPGSSSGAAVVSPGGAPPAARVPSAKAAAGARGGAGAMALATEGFTSLSLVSAAARTGVGAGGALTNRGRSGTTGSVGELGAFSLPAVAQGAAAAASARKASLAGGSGSGRSLVSVGGAAAAGGATGGASRTGSKAAASSSSSSAASSAALDESTAGGRDEATPTTPQLSLLEAPRQSSLAAAAGYGGGVGAYASPGSSPIATGVLHAGIAAARARSRSTAAAAGTASYLAGPTVSPVAVPAARAAAAPAPARVLEVHAEYAASQGDALRSAKVRSPLVAGMGSPPPPAGGGGGGGGLVLGVAGSTPTSALHYGAGLAPIQPPAALGGLRYAGTGVVLSSPARSPAGFGGGLYSLPAGSSPSRYGRR